MSEKLTIEERFKVLEEVRNRIKKMERCNHEYQQYTSTCMKCGENEYVTETEMEQEATQKILKKRPKDYFDFDM